MEIKFDEARLGRVRAAAKMCPQSKALLEEILPEAFDVPHKFKVGDRVTRTIDCTRMSGMSGRVAGYSNGNSVLVEFDDSFPGGHDGLENGASCEGGRGWYCHESDLIPEEKWEDVTGALEVIPGWICSEQNSVAVGLRGSTSVGNFIVVVNPRVPCGGGYKIENGRAYRRVTP